MFLLGQMAERFKAIVLKTIVVESHRGFESLSVRRLEFIMKKEQAEHIKSVVEAINKKFHPIELKCDIGYGNTEEHWYATIVFDLSDDVFLDLASLKFNFETIMDRLKGWEFALAAVANYKQQEGSLYFVTDKKNNYLKFNSDDSPRSDEWWDQS